MGKKLSRWVVTVADPGVPPQMNMISVDEEHTGDEVGQAFAAMNKERLTPESKIFVFPADKFCEMLRDRGDERSQGLADMIEEAFENEPVTWTPPSLEETHDDQGIPKDGQETG